MRVIHAPSFCPWMSANGSDETTGPTNGAEAPGLAGRLTSVRNTPVKLSDSEAGKIFDSRKTSLHQELAHLHAAASKQRAIADKDIGLAAYLTSRATVHQTIDGEELRHLRKANDSVNRTRELLFHGRGNVTADLAKSQEPYWRTLYVQIQTKINPRDPAFLGAMAVKMGAGNCGEHAWANTAVHGSKLDDGETVQTVYGANGLDHAWCETQLPGRDRIIMDAWAEGPAVMAKDSTFSFRIDRRNVIASLNQDGGTKFAQRTQDHLNHLNARFDLDQDWAVFKEKMQMADRKLNAEQSWEPTPVLHENFKFKVNSRQQSANAHAALLKEGMDEEHGITARLALGRELKAVGSARALGSNLRQAWDAKDQILKAMDRQNASMLRSVNRSD
jgi:hypothetical protein